MSAAVQLRRSGASWWFWWWWSAFRFVSVLRVSYAGAAWLLRTWSDCRTRHSSLTWAVPNLHAISQESRPHHLVSTPTHLHLNLCMILFVLKINRSTVVVGRVIRVESIKTLARNILNIHQQTNDTDIVHSRIRTPSPGHDQSWEVYGSPSRRIPGFQDPERISIQILSVQSK